MRGHEMRRKRSEGAEREGGEREKKSGRKKKLYKT